MWLMPIPCLIQIGPHIDINIDPLYFDFPDHIGMSKLRPDTTIETLNQRSLGFLPGQMGLEMLELSENSLTSRMRIQSFHIAPNTFLHAGSVITLADTTCGYATVAHLPEGAISFTTIELKSNFISTLRQGVAGCKATAQHLGRNTQVWDAVVFDEATDKKIAIFRCTQMILWPKS